MASEIKPESKAAQSNGKGSVDFSGMSCPLPLQDYPNVILGHGGGGSTVFDVSDGRMAFSTDSYVVQPLFFPGGSIGDLAVNGTVNDLSMSGATPVYLSAGFIIEEQPRRQLAFRSLPATPKLLNVVTAMAVTSIRLEWESFQVM